MNYFETYAPVVTWFAIRLMIIFGIIFGWALCQVDFVMAYPYAKLPNTDSRVGSHILLATSN